MLRIIVTSYGSFGLEDYTQLEAGRFEEQGATWNFEGSLASPVTKSIYVTQGEFDRGVKKALDRAAQKRIPLTPGVLASRTHPLLSYTVQPFPGNRPSISYVRSNTGLPLGANGSRATGSITAVAGSAITGAKATGSIVCVAGAALIDGETVTVNDGTNPAVVFEFDNDASVAPGHTAITFTEGSTRGDVQAALIAAINAATLSIDASPGGMGITLVHQRCLASGNIAISDTVANVFFTHSGMSGGVNDGETFTLDDGLHTPTVFEFDRDGTVGAGNIPVVTNSGMTATQVRDAILDAINSADQLDISGVARSTNGIDLLNHRYGDPGNTTSAETVGDGGFVVSDMTGGGTTDTILTFGGTNLISGETASYTHGSGSRALVLTSVRKGPIGEVYIVNILAPSGAGSVVSTYGIDGAITFDVTPAVAGPGAIAVAAQINGSRMGQYIGAVGGGTGAVSKQSNIKLTLNGRSAGAGVAYVDLATSAARTKLHIKSVIPGNPGNEISVILGTPAGGGSVTVLRKRITVVPAAAATTALEVATQINNSAAAALVTASVLGTNGDAVALVSESFLYGGAGLSPTLTLGTGTATILSYSDTSITCGVDLGDLSPVPLPGDCLIAELTTDYGALQAPVALASL